MLQFLFLFYFIIIFLTLLISGSFVYNNLVMFCSDSEGYFFQVWLWTIQKPKAIWSAKTPCIWSWPHTQVIATMDGLRRQWWFSWCDGRAAHSQGIAVQTGVALSWELWSCRFRVECKCKERSLWPYDSVF